MKIKSLSLYLVAVSLYLGGTSCHKADGPVLNLGIAAPSDVQMSLDGQTLTAGWQYQTGQPVAGFIAQLAKDDGFKSLIATDTVDIKTMSLKFDSVGLLNQYYFRVMAMADNIARNSVFTSATLTLESILLDVDPADVTGTSVVLKWNAPDSGSVSDIILQSTDSAAMAPVQLTSSDISSQRVTIDGLDPATTYRAIIYDGTTRKGMVTFTTVDTRASITIGDGTQSYTSLQAAIDAASAGDVINVQGTWDFSAAATVTVDKSLTIQANPDGKRPTITTGNFDLSGSVSALKLSGLKLIGTALQEITVSGLVGSVVVTLDDCDISGPGAGLIYASSSATGQTTGLVVNNCVIHDFGATGGDLIDFRAGSLTEMHITNTTFSNVARAFFRIDNPVAYTGTDPITMENCTVYHVCDGGRFLYIRAPNITMEINKCILANEVSNQSNGIPTTTATDNNVSGTNSGSFLQYVTQTGTTTLDPQFADPGNEDFTVGNATLSSAKIGDPRWLP